jgi:hypothetical protein
MADQLFSPTPKFKTSYERWNVQTKDIVSIDHLLCVVGLELIF